MDTKELVIDDETMEMLKQSSARTGRSLEELINNYAIIFDMGHRAKMGAYQIDKTKMSPSLAAFAGCLGKLPDDYDWKKDIEDALYEEYIKKNERNFC